MQLKSMVAEPTLSATEAAKRLGLRTADVYRRIDAGELAAAKGERGLVVVRSADVERLAST